MNAFITALDQVALQLQATPDADRIMEILGAELKRLGITCFVALAEPGIEGFILRYASIESRPLAVAERLTGPKLRGFHLRREHIPRYAELVEQKRAIFAPDAIALATPALSGLGETVAKRALQAIGVLSNVAGIVLPLAIEERLLGIAGLWGPNLRENDLTAMSLFANQVAVALENARLLAIIREHEHDLQRVSAQAINAQEAERQRISHELHDEMGQALTAVSINLAAVQTGLPAEAAAERLSEVRAIVEQTLERMRELSLELRPAMLDEWGLVAALRWYINRYTQRLSINVEFRALDLEERLPRDVETVLYRVIQEALTNVARHAHARRASVHLRRDESAVVAIVEDNGKGFDVEGYAGRQGLEKGVGLLGIQERVAYLGGRLTIRSRPGKGTWLSVEVPLQPRGGGPTLPGPL